MDSHDPKRIAMGRGRQNWRAFRPVMHLHENHYTKRAGVAGIRARADATCSNCLLMAGITHITNIFV
ncbi:hypothetical protein L8O45_09795 [Enterobacter bugandensis]|nr:hypothetical protein [Enterobacter bugandensis]MCK7088980.1 hypothetical protein [Enterobacter bugandensis]MCK7117584.1 hypothetical protein [Enterobacter bugandensis]